MPIKHDYHAFIPGAKNPFGASIYLNVEVEVEAGYFVQ